MSEPVVLLPPSPPLAPPPGVEGELEPPRYVPARPWSRLGGLALEAVLMACTFGFGWVGWWIIAWADGQTPSKVVLHQHVVTTDGRVASFGRMALREAVGKGAAGALLIAAVYYGQPWLLGVVAAYAVAGAVLALADPHRRTLWDHLAGTIVVEGDPPPIGAVVTPPVEADTEPS